MSTNNSSSPLLSQFILSLITPTLIISKISSENLIDLLVDMGKASEEIFRGDQLPILKDTSLDS